MDDISIQYTEVKYWLFVPVRMYICISIYMAVCPCVYVFMFALVIFCCCFCIVQVRSSSAPFSYWWYIFVGFCLASLFTVYTSFGVNSRMVGRSSGSVFFIRLTGCPSVGLSPSVYKLGVCMNVIWWSWWEHKCICECVCMCDSL